MKEAQTLRNRVDVDIDFPLPEVQQPSTHGAAAALDAIYIHRWASGDKLFPEPQVFFAIPHRLGKKLAMKSTFCCTSMNIVRWLAPSGISPGRYQLLAYTVAANLESGLLIYAAGEGEPAQHTIPSVNKTLHIETRNLVGSIDAIRGQINRLSVALEFMLERGCLVTRSRRHYPASTFLYEDARCEFMFLAELPY